MRGILMLSIESFTACVPLPVETCGSLVLLHLQIRLQLVGVFARAI